MSVIEERLWDEIRATLTEIKRFQATGTTAITPASQVSYLSGMAHLGLDLASFVERLDKHTNNG